MREKKIPMRKCIGCMVMKEKRQLVRIVKAPETAELTGVKEISVDTKGKMPGRGAYICKNPDCLAAARKAKRLERAFSCKIPDDIYEQIEKELKKETDVSSGKGGKENES